MELFTWYVVGAINALVVYRLYLIWQHDRAESLQRSRKAVLKKHGMQLTPYWADWGADDTELRLALAAFNGYVVSSYPCEIAGRVDLGYFEGEQGSPIILKPSTPDLAFDPVHQIILDTRYVLEAAGERLKIEDETNGNDLCAIGHALPYLWSGGRDIPCPTTTAEVTKRVGEIVARHGLSFPEGREMAVRTVLHLAHKLLYPYRRGGTSSVARACA